MLDAICPRSENKQAAGGSHPAADHLTLPRGVVVARQPLELKSMVRIHAGQPNHRISSDFNRYTLLSLNKCIVNDTLLARDAIGNATLFTGVMDAGRR